MIRRLLHRFTFGLERFIVRGALHQLLFIAALIVLVSIVSGTVVFLAAPDFGDYHESIWWGFLRLTDPGYLGDDKGVVARTVSTIVTILGYVLFMGALIAIMTQGLGRLMRRLESGVSPITLTGHILILGWTNRTLTIVKELLLSEGRVQRFLHRMHTNRLKVVIMAEEVSADLVMELKASLGELWDPSTLILRSGSPLHKEHLSRVDFMNAAAIILPADDFSEGGAETLDARIVKTILSLANTGDRQGSPLPILTTELFDSRKMGITRSAYSGDIEIIPGSTVISRLIAQNVRHSGLSNVYAELLTHSSGNEIYMREFPELVGRPFRELAARFQRAIPLGVIRPDGDRITPCLNPASDFEIRGKDRLVFVAENYDAIAPDGVSEDGDLPVAAPIDRKASERSGSRRVLVLGWNHKLPSLLTEFLSYTGEKFVVTVVSRVPAEERRIFNERFAGDLSRIDVEHVEADFTAPHDLQGLHPENYDNVVFLSSDRLDSGEESDARTILSYLLLRTILPPDAGTPEILIELVDPDNHALFANRPGEVLISPVIISHMLAHVTLRRDLWTVFEELFTANGAEIYFRPPSYYRAEDRALLFSEIQRLVAAQGDIALGVYTRRGQDGALERLHLNPARDTEWPLSDNDEIVVLTTYT
ncbi:MAG: ion channel DMI1 [Alphaproteobacteria bacterium]|nr:ion channel DMI1 [Alphaproteobacteria bacterium]